MTFDEIEQKYKTKLPYPTRPEMPGKLKHQLKERAVVNFSKIKEFDHFVEQTYKATSYEYKDWKDYKAALEKYRIAKEAYQEDQNLKEEQFRQDALEECGLLNHPKALKAYSFAWEHGHSAGLYEIFYWLTEIADLVS